MRKLFFLSTPTILLHFDEDTLMYVQADGNYIILHFRDSTSKVMTMQLHEFEELLAQGGEQVQQAGIRRTGH